MHQSKIPNISKFTYLLALPITLPITSISAQTDPNTRLTKDTLESAIKRVILEENKNKIQKNTNNSPKSSKNPALARNAFGSYHQASCYARGEYKECCDGDNIDCTSPDMTCFCDQSCVERSDCCEDYESTCLNNPIYKKTCNGELMGTISGDPHYQSFDGRNLAYQGRCSYTVTKVCDEFRGESGLQYFSVNAKNEQREETGPNVTWTQDIWIEFSAGFDYKLEIRKGRLPYVNGQLVELPYSDDSSVFTIAQAGRFIQIQTIFNVRVQFDGEGTAHVNLGCEYFNKTCGLLGNANGDPNDDYFGPDGTIKLDETSNLIDKQAFGDSWLLEGMSPEECNTPQPECSEYSVFQAYQQCNKLGLAPFDSCHDAVAYTETMQNCMYDVCASGENKLRCDHYQTYADLCEGKGIDFKWRNITNCPLECGTDEVFRSCSCDSTCDSYCDPNECREGCFCKAGFVRDSAGKCVSSENCSCSKNGLSFGKNEKYINEDCQEMCRCTDPIGNDMVCEDHGCLDTEECRPVSLNDSSLGGFFKCKKQPLSCLKKKGPHNGPPMPDWIPPNSCCGEKPYNDQLRGCCGGGLYSLEKKNCCDDKLTSSVCK